MKLFVIGANGRTGTEILDLAGARGHEVTAFVRSPAKLTLQDARLRVGIRAGVGETRGQLGPLYNWLLIPLLLHHVFADKERQEATAEKKEGKAY